jgi:hypothetical protein
LAYQQPINGSIFPLSVKKVKQLFQEVVAFALFPLLALFAKVILVPVRVILGFAISLIGALFPAGGGGVLRISAPYERSINLSNSPRSSQMPRQSGQ